MKIQHLIPILFLAAFCTASAEITYAQAYSNFLAEQTLHRSGVVRYADGAPAAGVHVTFYGHYLVIAGQMKFPADYDDPVPADDYNFQEAITDKDGHYDIIPPKKIQWKGYSSNSPNIQTNHIMARDFEKNLAAVQAFPVTTTNVDLVLQPAITLSGSVKNAEGAPLSGAAIELRFIPGLPYILDMHPPFKANDLGQYSIPALPQGIVYSILQNRAKGYGSSQVGVNVKDTQTNHYEFPALVPKHADRIVAGRVLDNNSGAPIAGAIVEFHSSSEQLTTRTKTDSDGRFFTDTVCEGEVRVRAIVRDFVFAGITVQAGATNVIIDMEPARPMPIDVQPFDIRPR